MKSHSLVEEFGMNGLSATLSGGPLLVVILVYKVRTSRNVHVLILLADNVLNELQLFRTVVLIVSGLWLLWYSRAVFLTT